MTLSDDCFFEGIPERPVGSRWGPFFKLLHATLIGTADGELAASG
jgi:hypothetical protein